MSINYCMYCKVLTIKLKIMNVLSLFDGNLNKNI